MPIVQVVLAAALGVAASSRAAWYDAPSISMRVEILAPCGTLDAPPTRVSWSATAPIAQLQLELDGDPPHLWLRRRFAEPTRGGSFALTMSERSAIDGARPPSITAIALSADGEWLAESAEAPLSIGATLGGAASAPTGPP